MSKEKNNLSKESNNQATETKIEKNQVKESLLMRYERLKQKYNEIEGELIFLRKLLKSEPHFRIISWIFDELNRKLAKNQAR